jgi:hypothetical protein
MDLFDDQQHNDMLDALAFSTFTHARLRHSPGDDPSAKSVRTWLSGVDIRLFAAGAFQNVLAVHSEEPSPALAAEWLDNVHQPDSAQPTHPPDAPQQPALTAAPTTAPPPPPTRRMSAANDTLFFSELLAHHWTIAHGHGGAYCETPAGMVWLSRPLASCRGGLISECHLEWHAWLVPCDWFYSSLLLFGLNVHATLPHTHSHAARRTRPHRACCVHQLAACVCVSVHSLCLRVCCVCVWCRW